MSEYSTQRDVIETLLTGIADIGRIHTRPRYGDAFEHWATDIDGVEQVRAWEIGMDPNGSVTVTDPVQNWRRRERAWMIRGWVSLIDDDGADAGTYDTIAELSETVGDTLDADFNLGGTCLWKSKANIEGPTPVFLPIGQGDVLCWGVEVLFSAVSEITP